MAHDHEKSKPEPRRWFRFYAEALDDPKVQRLPPHLFKEALLSAVNGKATEFSRWLRPGRDRMVGDAWIRLRRKIFSRDDYTCRYCGLRGGRLECDHIVPVSRGGSNGEDNLTAACKPCNQAKRDKLISEWKGIVA